MIKAGLLALIANEERKIEEQPEHKCEKSIQKGAHSEPINEDIDTLKRHDSHYAKRQRDVEPYVREFRQIEAYVNEEYDGGNSSPTARRSKRKIIERDSNETRIE